MDKQTQQGKQGHQRNALGQFVPGHAGGPGRPSAQREAAFLRAARSAVSPEEFGEACRAVWQIAVDPDARAADKVRALEVLARHYLPMPNDRNHLEVTLSDPAELQEFRVAGALPSTLDATVAEGIRQLAIERQAYDQELARRGLLPRHLLSAEQLAQENQQ